MADALKRQNYAEHKEFQQRAGYYFWLRSAAVLADASPDADDLKLAKAVYAGQVSLKDMGLTIITNTSIGTTLDGDGAPTDSDIEWAVITDNQFHKLAVAYVAAGLA